LSLSTYDLARKRVIVYIKEVLHQRGYLDWKTALPEKVCKAVGFNPLNNAEAVKFVIAFSQSKVVEDVWRRRRKTNRALRAKARGSLPSEEFYASLSWRKIRYQALARSAGRCECCGATGDKAPLHVDHIKPRSKYPDLALVIANLQVLCADCNIGKLNQDETDWRKPVLKIA
jgi:5-methylcytosine-specific restriction endonuclease McrA